MLARRSAPSSMAIYPSKNTPYSVVFSEKAPPFRFLTSQARDKSGVASQSKCRFTCISTRLATNAFVRRFAPSNAVAGQPSLRPARMHNYTDRKKEPYLLVWFFFLTGSYLSFQAASSQVLSTYKGLTTVFGMGTGGSP